MTNALSLYFCLFGVLSAGAGYGINSYLMNLSGLVAPSLCSAVSGAMVIFVFLNLFSRTVVDHIKRKVFHAKYTLVVSGFLFASYGFYFWGAGNTSYVNLILFAGCFCLPLMLVGHCYKFHWVINFLVLAGSWVVFDERLLAHLWSWPNGEMGYVFNALLLCIVIAHYFYLGRGLVGSQYFVKLTSKDLKLFVKYFLLMLIVCLPIAWALDFVAWQGIEKYKLVPLRFVAIFLTIAIPEELVFRGVLQNLFSKYLSPWIAILLGAVLFGMTHYNNGAQFDWRYVFLATVAGCFYGRLYLLSGSVFIAGLLHAAVDTAWLLFFLK